MSGEGPCEDCGGGLIHTGEEFLCAACHRPSKRWLHLGPTILDDAIAWAKERRAAGAGLPRAVVKSYAPSEACLCPVSDCFFFSFMKFRFEDNRQTCIPCGTHKSSQWRTGGERARQYQLYFTGEEAHHTDRSMRKTKEVIAAVSDICNSCHMAFYGFTKSPGRLPTTNELLAAPAGKELPQGIDKANIAVVRHMYKALAAGNMVCSEDIAVVLARKRRDNKVKDLSDKYMQVTVSNMMKEVGEGVSDVRVREYRGATLGEDGRTTFVYLFPTNINVDVLASTDRKLRRMQRAYQDLRQHLQDTRGDGGSGSGSATVTPRMHDERVEAANIGGMDNSM